MIAVSSSPATEFSVAFAGKFLMLLIELGVEFEEFLSCHSTTSFDRFYVHIVGLRETFSFELLITIPFAGSGLGNQGVIVV